MPSRYINPYTDFGFKKLFGEEANKDLLIDFLNAVLPAENRVADLTFRNSEQLPDNIVDRKAIFDIACVGGHNESFTVEMQKAKQLYFKDRALFYSSFPIQWQAQKGDWNFRLNPVFLVAVLDFEYDEHEERRKLYRVVTLKDQDGDPFLETLKMIFLQMPLFRLQEPELVTQKDKWLFFLKNLESFDDIPAILREPVFEKAFNTAEYLKYPPAVQEAYQRDLMIYRDNRNVLETARLEGLTEGEAKGRAKGLAEGRAEGLASVARNLKRKGMSVSDIADATGLPVGAIERLS
ncbi:MAG: Rpn family recombination-promoting nuclease/putative transposase [Planctomycetaceae bacterium]|jgi:predicted transposase/invertase (TIGR01784 family)|nr:Rpn family recombination-promoting nuclease/putative transposase [Planctomycetaceae bacterium]